VHHSVAWYFFVVGLFLMWAWGAADSVHKLKQPDGESVPRIVCNWIVVLLCIALMLIMTGVAIIALMKGML
jgi:hypothetical protein